VQVLHRLLVQQRVCTSVAPYLLCPTQYGRKPRLNDVGSAIPKPKHARIPEYTYRTMYWLKYRGLRISM
jgi:hypothetical protein